MCTVDIGSEKWIEIQYLLLFYRFPSECFHIGNQRYKYGNLGTTKSMIVWRVRNNSREAVLLLPEEIKDMDTYASSIMEKCVNKGRYIVFLLSLKNHTRGKGHANILLFDRLTGELFRFDPHGNTNKSWMPEELNNQLIASFSSIYKRLLINPDGIDKLTYITFKDVNHGVESGPQIIQGTLVDSDRNFNRAYIINDELSDMMRGSCSIWCFIFIYLRMYYPDVGLSNILRIITQSVKGSYNLWESLYLVSQQISKVLYEVKKGEDSALVIPQGAWSLQIEQLFPSPYDEDSKHGNSLGPSETHSPNSLKIDEKSLMFGTNEDATRMRDRDITVPEEWWNYGHLDAEMHKLFKQRHHEVIYGVDIFEIISTTILDLHTYDFALRFIAYLLITGISMPKVVIMKALRKHMKYKKNLLARMIDEGVESKKKIRKLYTEVNSQQKFLDVIKKIPSPYFVSDVWVDIYFKKGEFVDLDSDGNIKK